MKIICIGRNYVDHVNELKNQAPSSPVIFMKPDTALLKDNAAFYYPDFSNEIHHEVEVLIKIDREGKNIQEKFSHKYYNEIGLGIDFTARDLQNDLKSKGYPWEIAKSFNGSAPVSEFISIAEFSNLQDLNFNLKINGIEKQVGNTKNMIFKIDFLISYISKFFTLKKGDIIFTGTPSGVGPVKIGDKLEGILEGKKLLDFEVK